MNQTMLVALIAVSLVSGCKKKPKEVPPDTAPPAASTPNPTPAPSGSGGPAGAGIIPVGGVGIVTNPGAVAGGGGGGAVQAVRKAVRRTQSLNEMNNLGQLIEGLRDPLGRMPTREQILVEVQKTAPGIHKGIEEGAYILTGTMDGGGLWAYEVDADQQPGIALIGGRAARTTPDEIRPYLARK
jgi:hypothetical protein